MEKSAINEVVLAEICSKLFLMIVLESGVSWVSSPCVRTLSELSEIGKNVKTGCSSEIFDENGWLSDKVVICMSKGQMYELK